jgi:hypothetical protein
LDVIFCECLSDIFLLCLNFLEFYSFSSHFISSPFGAIFKKSFNSINKLLTKALGNNFKFNAIKVRSNYVQFVIIQSRLCNPFLQLINYSFFTLPSTKVAVKRWKDGVREEKAHKKSFKFSTTFFCHFHAKLFFTHCSIWACFLIRVQHKKLSNNQKPTRS